MKLNYDCIRDVLLYLEENLQYRKEKDNKNYDHTLISLNDICEDLSGKYLSKDIRYSIEKLHEANFITFDKIKSSHLNNYAVSDITWDGHDFLDSIRADNIWEATKKGADKLKVMSLTSVKLIAGQLIKAIISDQRVVDVIIKELL